MFRRYWQNIVGSIHLECSETAKGEKAFLALFMFSAIKHFGQKVLLPSHTEALSRAGYLHTGIVDLHRFG